MHCSYSIVIKCTILYVLCVLTSAISDGISQVQMDLYTPAASSMAFHATMVCSKGLLRLVLHMVNWTGAYRPPAVDSYVIPRGRSTKVQRSKMKMSMLTKPRTCKAT